MISIVLSVSVEVVGLRLTPTRVLLIASFLPLMVGLFSGRLGPVTVADWLLLFLCFWMVVSLLITGGTSKFAFGVISAVELFGSYALGRYLIKNARDFRLMVKWHLALLALMMPFAIVEFLVGTQYWASVLDTFGDVQYRQNSSRPRFGFNRVLAGFEHPILYGIYCSMLVGSVFYIWQRHLVWVGISITFVVGMTFMSLSSGAVLSVCFQIGLIVWGLATNNRWLLLVCLVLGSITFLELASNRGAVSIFISTFAFDGSTAWTRITQWNYGSAEVLRHPIFGKGLSSDWVRPSWLYTSSIDNYWLVVAFRHGLPAIAAQLLALAIIVLYIVRAGPLPEASHRIRTGYMIVMAGVCFSLATVHIWDSNVIFFFFYLGAGLWLIDQKQFNISPEQPVSSESEALIRRGSRYTRFPDRSDNSSDNGNSTSRRRTRQEKRSSRL